MEMRTWQNGETLHISIVGSIDDQDTPFFREHLQLLLDLDYSAVIMDFSAVPFICSSAIGRLLLFNRHVRSASRHLRVRGISDQVWKLFEYTNVNLLFPIESKEPRS